MSTRPWLCTGDFNEILRHDEKEGGCGRPNGQINAFREVVEECGLSELGFSGSKFTWANYHPDWTWTRLRLDRGLANGDWKTGYPNAQTKHLFTTASDHHSTVSEIE